MTEHNGFTHPGDGILVIVLEDKCYHIDRTLGLQIWDTIEQYWRSPTSDERRIFEWTRIRNSLPQNPEGSS